MPIQRVDLEIAELTTRIIGPLDAPLTVVLMHGFGAPGDDLVPLAQYIAAPARFVFPAAPLALGGMYGPGRAWWPLDLVKLEAELRSGGLRDRRSEVPEGMPAVREQISRLLDELPKQLGTDPARTVLGGFSQGAMLAVDVALHREVAPTAVVALSATLLAEAEWLPRMARLAGVPVFQSHGRHDPLLPFAISEALRDHLRTAGAKLEWHEFAGGHEIPPRVLEALGAFLTARV